MAAATTATPTPTTSRLQPREADWSEAQEEEEDEHAETEKGARDGRSNGSSDLEHQDTSDRMLSSSQVI